MCRAGPRRRQEQICAWPRCRLCDGWAVGGPTRPPDHRGMPYPRWPTILDCLTHVSFSFVSFSSQVCSSIQTPSIPTSSILARVVQTDVGVRPSYNGGQVYVLPCFRVKEPVPDALRDAAAKGDWPVKPKLEIRMAPKSGFEMCFAIGSQHVQVLGVPTKTRLESSVIQCNAHLIIQCNAHLINV